MADNNFIDWITLGDQWIISYLNSTPMHQGTVNRFSIAHAFEQYFKACLVRKYDSEKAMTFGHKIYNMFIELKKDTNFLPNLNIPQDVYSTYNIETAIAGTWSEEQILKIIPLQHFLLLFKYTADLKYQRFKNANGQIAMTFVYPDDRYAEIIFEIRKYLSIDSEANGNLLKDALTNDLIIKDELFQSKILFIEICLRGRK
ncbi:MAG: hypothetical protein IT246_09370 [Bacteroidia bacterium]|nr:hypothetical protein [Bacteroidia bacterium]